MMFLCRFADRSLMAKKADGIKESADSNATIEEEETRGQYQFICKWHLNTSSVACLWWSVAVSMIHRQGMQSLAFLQAEWIQTLTDCTSVSIALSQVVRGHPQGLLLWLGGRSDAPMTRWCFCLGSAHATCPKKWSCLSWIRLETKYGNRQIGRSRD